MAITTSSLSQLYQILTKNPLKLHSVSEFKVAQLVIQKEDEIDRRIMEVLKTRGLEKNLVIRVSLDIKGKGEMHDKAADVLMERYVDAGWNIGDVTKSQKTICFNLVTLILNS